MLPAWLSQFLTILGQSANENGLPGDSPDWAVRLEVRSWEYLSEHDSLHSDVLYSVLHDNVLPSVQHHCMAQCVAVPL